MEFRTIKTNKLNRIHFKIVFLYFFFISALLAETQYKIKHYTSENGIQDSYIRGIQKDKQGFIWLITLNGITRFDGQNFTNFTPKDKIFTSFYKKIIQTSEYGLLFLNGEGISYFDSNSFRSIKKKYIEDKTNFNHIQEDKNHDVWIASQNVLYKFENNQFSLIKKFQQTIRELLIDQQGELLIQTSHQLWKNTNHEFVNLIDNIPEIAAGSFSDQLGNILIKVTDGVYIFNNGSLLKKNFNQPDHKISLKNFLNIERLCYHKIFFDHNSNLFLIHNSQLFQIVHPSTQQFSELKLTENNLQHISCIEINDTLLVKKKDQCQLIDKKSHNIEGSVLSCFIDTNETLWIGTTHGLLQLLPLNYQEIKLPVNNLKPNNIIIDNNNSVWISFPNDGIFHNDEVNTNFQQINFPLRTNEIVKTIQLDSKNRKLIATNQRFLLYKDSSLKELYSFNDSYKSGPIEDQDQNIWLIDEKNIYRYKNDSLVQHQHQFKLENDLYQRLYKNLNGDLFLKSEKSHYQLTDHQWLPLSTLYPQLKNKDRIFYFFNSDHNEIFYNINYCNYYKINTEGTVIDLNQKLFPNENDVQWKFQYKDQNNTIWFLTNKGIVNYKNHEFNTFPVNQQFGINTLYFCFEYQDYIIFISRQGLVFLNQKDNSMSFVSDIPKFRSFLSDLSAIDQEGRLYYFSRESLICYEMNQFSFDGEIPQTYITDLYINGVKQKLADNYKLNYDEKNIHFHFSGIAFKEPENIIFRYKLQGFQNQWQQTINRQLQFNALNFGDYTFYIQAINLRTSKSYPPVKIDFSIEKPFWRSIPFYIISSLFLLSITLLVSRLLIIHRSNQLLNSKIDEKTSELQQANDELGQQKSTLEEINKELEKEILDRVKAEKKIYSYHKRVEKDLELAKKVQFSMMKNQIKFNPHVESFSNYIPSEKLSGDFFQMEQVTDEEYVFYIADVSGHGIAASMVSSLGKSLTQLEIEHQLIKNNQIEPHLLLSKINQRFIESNLPNDSYMTMFAGVYHTQNHLFRFSVAAHPYVFILKSKEMSIKRLEYPAKAIGWFSDAQFKEYNISVEPHDKILLLTDGVLEAYNQNQNIFGLDSLIQSLNRSMHKLKLDRSLSAQFILDQLLKDLFSFSGGEFLNDDISLLLINIKK